MHDLLGKYAIISSKINKIHVFTCFDFPIFFRIIRVIYFINMQIFHGNCQNLCFLRLAPKLQDLPRFVSNIQIVVTASF